MRSLPKLIPGVHHKLPDGAQDEVQRIYGHAEEHGTELNLYMIGEGGEDEHTPGAEGVPAETLAPEPDEPKELA
jgi:hypothetical protein